MYEIPSPNGTGTGPRGKKKQFFKLEKQNYYGSQICYRVKSEKNYLRFPTFFSNKFLILICLSVAQQFYLC